MSILRARAAPACRVALVPLVLLSLAGCHKHARQLPSDNDSARFLAGLPVQPGHPFSRLEQAPLWQRYSADIAQRWAKAEQLQFERIDAFQRNEIAPLKSHSDFIFYPFSGPDVVYVTRFFPGAKVYLLCGLEPVGKMPVPADFANDAFFKYRSLEAATDTIFRLSFFITGDLQGELHGAVANGVVPVIGLLMARGGYTIDRLQYGHIDDNGGFVAVERDAAESAEAVEMSFHGDACPAGCKLYYLSTDLGLPFAAKSGVSRFIRSLGTPDTFVKSASFLMHHDDFSALREQILTTSNLILQDDSGIPYHDFKDAGYQVQLFGQYSGPDRYYEKEYQPDLAADFKESAKVKPLGFAIGYGALRRPSSLMLAVRPQHR